MAKRERNLSEKAIRRWREEGRGQGEGTEYMPWLTIQDVASQGQSGRILGWKTARVHHLLSQNELRYFYLLEWSSAVVDIREQYPLFSPEDTQNIAAALGVKHPTAPGEYPTVMTSDFRISLVNGGDCVRTVKSAGHLDDNRILEKLDIEREYWRQFKVDWGVIVAEDIPLPLAKNIQWLHDRKSLDGLDFDVENVPDLASYLTQEVQASPDIALCDITSRCDREFNLDRGSCLGLACHLIANRQWEVDMTVRIYPTDAIRLLDVRGV